MCLLSIAKESHQVLVLPVVTLVTVLRFLGPLLPPVAGVQATSALLQSHLACEAVCINVSTKSHWSKILRFALLRKVTLLHRA